MTTPPTTQLAPEQILRAADYVEPAWRERGSEEDRAALAEFHADGPELARLIGEFGALLLADYLTVVPDEHADCGCVGENEERMSAGAGSVAGLRCLEMSVRTRNGWRFRHRFDASTRGGLGARRDC